MPHHPPPPLLQDICGIHNLHGMPSIIAALVAIFSTLGISQREDASQFPRGTNQPGYQVAGMAVTLGTSSHQAL